MAGFYFLFRQTANRFYKEIDILVDQPVMQTSFFWRVQQLASRLFRAIANFFSSIIKKISPRKTHTSPIGDNRQKEIAGSSYKRIRANIDPDRYTLNESLNVESTTLDKLFNIDIPEENPFGNTELTEYLASLAFDLDLYKENQVELLQTLTHLTAIAAGQIEAPIISANQSRQLLQQANQVTSLGRSLVKDGVPSNTPLMLLSKMGEQEGAVKIIPFYDREHLLHANERGNTALHFAAFTGQLHTVKAILERAKELGILQEVLTAKNKNNYSGADIYHKIMTLERHTFFGTTYLVFADEHFGGEEINKANIGKCSLLHTRIKSNKFGRAHGIKNKLTFNSGNVLTPQQFLLNCCLISHPPKQDSTEPVQGAISPAYKPCSLQ